MVPMDRPHPWIKYVVAGKIWDVMGYGGLIPYQGMVWDLTARYHPKSHANGMGYYA